MGALYFPLGVAAAIFFIHSIIKSLYANFEAQRFNGAQVHKRDALIVAKRYQASIFLLREERGYTTLELANGSSKELLTLAGEIELAPPGAMGIAYFRDKYLVHFERALV